MAEDIFGIVGTTQGPFSVQGVVAEGGFGVVYRAHHDAFRAPVALKCLKIPGEFSDELRKQFMEQFREEAELLFRLSAAISSVVRPLHHDVLSTKSGQFVPFIALEWLEGQTLESFILSRRKKRYPPLDLKEAAMLLAPVARALESAHGFPGAEGPICVVHRDLKPANIFLASLHGTEVVKVLDFGIARARDAASVIAGQTTESAAGAPTAFTPCYGAPEQWAPKRFGATGPWTDVWGLALTYMEIITGRTVIHGDQMAIMGTVLDEKRRPTPRNENVIVPDRLEAAFQKALVVDPRERYHDVGLFWNEVERALGLELTTPPIARPSIHAQAMRPGSLPPSVSAPTVQEPPIPRPAAVPQIVSPKPPPGRVLASGPAPDRPRQPGAPKQADAKAPVQKGNLSMAVDRNHGAKEFPSNLRNKPPEPGPRHHGLKEFPSELRNKLPADIVAPISPNPRLKEYPSSLHNKPPHEGLRDGASSMRHRLPPPPIQRPQSTARELRSIFGLPVRLAVAGVVVSIIDQAVSLLLLNGQRLSLGPVRLLWIAAGLVLIGILMAIFRMFESNR